MFQIIQAFIMFTYLFRLSPAPAILSIVFFKRNEFDLIFK
jgi:hypothetical protein